jgi:hypothetical protein
MYVSTCVRKYLICELTAEWMYDGAAEHLSRAVRDVLNNTHYDRRTSRTDPLHRPSLRQIWILWICTRGDTSEPLIMQLLLTRKRHFTVGSFTSVRLSATAPASLNGCCGPWWDASRRVLNLMEDILSTYYNRTLSAIAHKLNASGHMLIWTHFPVLVSGTRAQYLSSPFSYISYMWYSQSN